MGSEYGDRRQELVFIGNGLDEVTLRARLDAALLTDEEMAAGPESWKSTRIHSLFRASRS